MQINEVENMAYLDNNGVTYLWGKIKSLFNKGITNLSVSGRTITYTKGDGTTGTIQTQDTNTTYSDFKGATASADGGNGLVPAPTKGNEGKYLKADGTWGTPANNTYSDFTGASSTADGAHGLVPKPTQGQQGMVLAADGKWHSLSLAKNPTADTVSVTYTFGSGSENTLTLPAATTSLAGVMTAADKSKLSALPSNSTLESTYAKKSEITNMYKYCGSVTGAAKLPTTGQRVGDVYNIEAASKYGGAGMNVAWNGTDWDPLGEIFTVTAITNEELDELCV
jgi:hypothetical protein